MIDWPYIAMCAGGTGAIAWVLVQGHRSRQYNEAALKQAKGTLALVKTISERITANGNKASKA